MPEDLLENYKRAYNNRLGFGQKPALLLIDLVQAYFDDNCALYADADEALASAIRLLRAARQSGVSVVFTNVVYDADGLNGGVFFKKAPVLENFIAGNPAGNWAPGLQPLDNELVISKQYPSAFFGTSLAETLHEQGVDSVLLTGLTTSGCVRASCVDAMSHGFIPVIVADACGDRHEAPHEANLLDMNAKYGDVVGEDEALAYLQQLNNSA